MRRLFVLRPEPGATATVEKAKALGLDAVAMPLFAAEPIAWVVPNAGDFDGLLLTSANAVRHAGDGLAKLRSLAAYSVGDATAEAAAGAGLEVVGTGNSGVDALLAQLAPDLRLLHLCGENRRPPTDPRQEITSVPVYCARALPAPAPLGDLAGQTIVVHSPRSAGRVAELLPVSERASVRLVAISTAAAEAAGSGWQDVAIAASPNDTELLALAARLCQNPDPT